MKHAPLLTATVQRVRGCASVAEPNQEAGPQEPEEDGVGAVCTAHGWSVRIDLI